MFLTLAPDLLTVFQSFFPLGLLGIFAKVEWVTFILTGFGFFFCLFFHPKPSSSELHPIGGN